MDNKNKIISSSFIRTMAKDIAVLEGKPIPDLVPESDKKKPIVPLIKKVSPPAALPVVESIRGPGIPVPILPSKEPEAPIIKDKSKTKHLKFIFIGLIVIILIGGVGGFFYWWNYLKVPLAHLECQDYQCITIEREGTDQCQINEDCQPIEPIEPIIPESLIEVDETETIELAVGEEDLILEQLRLFALEWQANGSFKRILVKLVSKDEKKYFDLDSLLTTLNVNFSENILSFISPAQVESGNYTLFLYGQEEGNRLGIILDIQEDLEITNQSLKDWEETMIEDLEILHLKDEALLPFTEDFQDNIHQEIAIRYINFPDPDLSIDYAVVDNKLVIATSRESMHAAIDALLVSGAENNIESNGQDFD